jgi:hypothetical protein
MTARMTRFAIALVIAALLAAPAIIRAQDRGRPPDDFGECMSDCVRGLSFLGNVGGKACQVFCRLTSPGGNDAR